MRSWCQLIFLFTFKSLLVLPVMAQTPLGSKLEVYSLDTSERELIYSEESHFEAPNWSPDGQSLIINQDGSLFTINLAERSKIRINTGTLDQCNNDHGISPDGRWLAISNNDSILNSEGGTSRIYLMPLTGGIPSLVTPLYPSYWHGWSPDSESLLYTANRNGDYDIYQIHKSGGKEKRLTEAKGLDDGPEYSADGLHIYYNSFASGRMEIWRMDSDGSNKVQLTDDEYSNWFPHPSPDQRHLVYLSYLEDQGDRHPALKNVALRLYDIESGTVRTLCSFIGGQGSINVPSWSPDGRKFAFVSYNSSPQ